MSGSRTTTRLRVINTGLRPVMRSMSDPERAWVKAVQEAQKIAGVQVDDYDRQ
ncbi:hypothetical protein [Glycomyces buryatensis]|uniref:hypothetical protein n=1 Tax=Glycomyces buryatensis TaxID=2570927 RepID=UPI0014562AE7|nr:hypothetical protein [Glycomyces buryatensis]